MKPLLLTISLLLSTPAWAGEVDGNSFFCKPVGVTITKKHFAVSFEDGKVHQYDGSKERRFKYKVNEIMVSWNKFWWSYTISRKSLVLRVEHIDAETIDKWQCQFMEFSKAKEIIKKLETLSSEQRKGNKF